MTKLFVALDIPAQATSVLVRLLPAAAPGMRLTDSSQMHLTLHFLGEADRDRTAARLTKVAASSFKLSFSGVGKFATAGGSTTLWAGVRVAPELLDLHSAIAAALAVEGFRPEARPYSPHLTLARGDAGFPESAIEAFLKTNERFSLPDVSMTSFGLYSSTLVSGVPIYTREREYPLTPH